MSLTIELTPESEQRLIRAAKQAGVKPEDYARSMIEALPAETHLIADRRYTASELLRLTATEQDHYLREVTERAAVDYLSDLGLPLEERELTALSAASGADYMTEQRLD